MKRLTALTIIFGSLLFTVCELALGTRINIKGPVVTISGPSANRAANETDPVVNTLFNLKGTAVSPNKIIRMTVTLDYWNKERQSLERQGRQWKYENGSWKISESADEGWKAYTNASYDTQEADPDKPVSTPKWSVNGDTVSWNLPVLLRRMEKGEYFITVSAWDQAENHDANSAQKIKVRYNNKAPGLKIRDPLLFGGTGSLAAPRPPDYNGYTFDPFGKPEQTGGDLKNFTNKFKGFSWEIELEDTMDGEYEMSFEITNQHNLDNPGQTKVVYYGWEWDKNNGLLPQMGGYTDVGSILDTIGTTRYKKVGNEIKFTGDGSTGDDSNCKYEIVKNLPKDRITPMQVVSRLKDNAGNVEYKSKGWFFYLPDSDKPYADINFAYKVKPNTPLSSIPANAPDQKVMTRNSTHVDNWAYDDDGVLKLEYKVYRLQDNSLNTDGAALATVTESFPNARQRENWTFRAANTYGIGRFKVEVTVTDIYNREGDRYDGYFTITSNSTPKIKQPFTAGTIGQTYWGDTYGKITISGTAEVECSDTCNGTHHEVKVDKVFMAWIKPGLGTENNLRYIDPNDPGWARATTGGFTDAYGNKVWVWDTSPSDFVSTTAGNKGANNQEEWNFSKDINYFSDLNIGSGSGQNPFSDQVFRVRVLSSATGKDLSSVSQVTTQGDIQAPKLEITSIAINNHTYPKYGLSGFGMIPAINSGDKVKLKGTWKDDSYDTWINHPNRISLLKNFVVRWEGRELNVSVPGAAISTTQESGEYVWETGEYTFIANNRDPIVKLSASLQDLNNNTGIAEEYIIVETDNPTLIRISSTTNDGRYGENKPTVTSIPASRYIDIFLEFNKAVEFYTSGSPNTSFPYLELNNSGRAFYLEGSGTNKIVFRYFTDGNYGTLATGSGGAATGGVSNTGTNRLNVTGIAPNSYPLANWVSVIGKTPATFPNDVYQASNTMSLSGGKNIVIDKIPPAISSITTSAQTSRPHSAGSQIYVTVNFTKPVQVSGQSATNLYLSLRGGNLLTNTAQARYASVAGASSISFLYTVGATHDTGSSHFEVDTFTVSGTARIVDLAGNPLAAAPAIPSGNITSNVIIKTSKPAAPAVTGIQAQSYYSTPAFNITGLESTASKVEYNLNYSSGGSWNVVPSSKISGTTASGIEIPLNGSYSIAVRQYDNAMPEPNESSIGTLTGTVRVDKGPLLVRIGSDTPDGIYSYTAGGTNIDIDLEFRIPLTLPTGTALSTVFIELNTSGGSGADPNRVTLLSPAAGASSNVWKFRYTVRENASVLALDVVNIDSLDTVTINDQYGTRVNGPNGWIKRADLDASNRFSGQKQIRIMAGRPVVAAPIPNGLLTNNSTTDNISFNNTGTQLSLIFDRDIYRGATADKLIIRQISDDTAANRFLIPAVMTESQWDAIFINRTDIFTEQSDLFPAATFNDWGANSAARAAAWENIGKALYQKGSNGATVGTGNNLNSDTTVKYVLKYDVNPTDANASTTGLTGTGFPANNNMGHIRTAFRAAEALRFSAADPEVTISGSTLNIALTGTKALPVRGAQYQWIFPNGFVKDFLNNGNGSASNTGADGSISSVSTAGGARVLSFNGTGAAIKTVETPVIRIDKGSDIETFNNTGANRQARQRLQSSVKINSRTPGAAITYDRRQTTDNVGRLITRNISNPTTPNAAPTAAQITAFGTTNTNNLPNIGTRATGAAGRTSFENTKMRPQSGVDGRGNTSPITGANWTGLGLNYFTAMADAWTAVPTYTADFLIGEDNYNTGGMEIHIRAQATRTGMTNSAYGYESAYRSVLVFNNQDIYGNDQNQAVGGGVNRVWVRGSNTTAGDPTVPDFPIARDPALSRKARLMTPIDGTGINQNSSFTYAAIPTTAVGAGGNHLWFWVTWKINVPAYVDVFYGTLPTDATDLYQTPRTNIRYLFHAYFPHKEHYALFPGRTTVMETRAIYAGQWDGDHGNAQLTSATTAPDKRD
ncbi:MAG: hypothetical protein LBH44_10025 [Treponema sp.]|jgi:hypothetical protein|nr:hypothetical protein [Treponema sp.]